MEPSVGSEGDVGVDICLSKTREKQITFHQSNRDNKPKLQINHDDNKTLTQILFLLMTISQNSADWDWYRIKKSAQYESDREFWALSIKHKYTPIRPTM
jgi:hypothetical protein